MTTQLDVFAQGGVEPRELVVDELILLSGANAEAVPRHEYLPSGSVYAYAGNVTSEAIWRAILELVEREMRWVRAGSHPDIGEVHKFEGGVCCAGSYGTGHAIELRTQKVTCWRSGEEDVDQSCSTVAAIAAVHQRRAQEPGIAHVRDLAEAYHLLDYYRRAYGNESRGEWTPWPFYEHLENYIRGLGGDPREVFRAGGCKRPARRRK